MNILIIGSGAREHAIAKALARSSHKPSLFCFGSANNPGIQTLCQAYTVGNINDAEASLSFAKKHFIDFIIIGPEAPLEAGVADVFWASNIPTIGPKKILAQIESSKGFTRDLLLEYHLPGCPAFKRCQSMDGVKAWLAEFSHGYVVKADGLMGGKGVKVSGEHLHSIEDALQHCQTLINAGGEFVLEEKLIGPEFSLISFSDGKHLIHTPAIQDHKRAFEGDTGPNTGGMGTYSDANHSLPFLNEQAIDEAKQLNQATIDALLKKTGEPYIGILYGGFMLTKDGVKLIEYNARFGDPEAMNIFSLLETDFVDICQHMLKGTLNELNASFANKATVCKYAVPEGYPDKSIKGEAIDVSAVKNPEHLFYGAVDLKDDQLIETGSRTVAYVGVGSTLDEAQAIAEREICHVKGPLFHRTDIGTQALIQKRIDLVKSL